MPIYTAPLAGGVDDAAHGAAVLGFEAARLYRDRLEEVLGRIHTDGAAEDVTGVMPFDVVGVFRAGGPVELKAPIRRLKPDARSHGHQADEPPALGQGFNQLGVDVDYRLTGNGVNGGSTRHHFYRLGNVAHFQLHRDGQPPADFQNDVRLHQPVEPLGCGGEGIDSRRKVNKPEIAPSVRLHSLVSAQTGSGECHVCSRDDSRCLVCHRAANGSRGFLRHGRRYLRDEYEETNTHKRHHFMRPIRHFASWLNSGVWVAPLFVF